MANKLKMHQLLHYIYVYAMLNGVFTIMHNHGDETTQRLAVCGRKQTDIVNDSYVANDLPDYDQIKECQKRLNPALKNIPAPRPCAMQVKVTLTFIDLMSIEAASSSIKMMVTYREEWRDRRLILPAMMNPACVENTSLKSVVHLRPPKQYRKQIWTPDFYMKGMLGIHVTKLGIATEDLTLRRDYVVESTLTMTLSLMCPMHFGEFPFDTHHCKITLESFGIFVDDLAIVWGKGRIDIRPAFSTGAYDVSASTRNASMVTYNDFTFPQLQMTLILRRERLKYTLLVFMPCMLHFLIAWLAFFLPKEVSQGRCIINCTTNLSLVSMLSVYMRHSPQGGYIKAIDVWVLFSIVFQFLCTIDSIIDIRLLYLAFTLQRQPREAADTEVLHIFTDTSNWIGKEVRLVEPEIQGSAVVKAVRDMHRLSRGLLSVARASVPAMSMTRVPPPTEHWTSRAHSSDRWLMRVPPTDRWSSRAPSYAPGTTPAPPADRWTTRAPSTGMPVTSAPSAGQPTPWPAAGEPNSFGQEAYHRFLGALVLYQEWSQWIYLTAYVLFAFLFWHIYVPKTT